MAKKKKEEMLPIKDQADKKKWKKIQAFGKRGHASDIFLVGVYNAYYKRKYKEEDKDYRKMHQPGTVYKESESLRKRGKKLSLSEILKQQKELKKKKKKKK